MVNSGMSSECWVSLRVLSEWCGNKSAMTFSITGDTISGTGLCCPILYNDLVGEVP